MEFNNFIGYLTFPSGKVLVSDPCYVKKEGKGIDENQIGRQSVSFWTLKVKEADLWQATMVVTDETGGWGMRVMKLRVAVQGWDDFSSEGSRYYSGAYGAERLKQHVATVHNDAGMIMIADREALNSWGNDEYVSPLRAYADMMNYSGACYAASDFGGLIGATDPYERNSLAVVSSSGYGDGQYGVNVWLDSDNDIVAIEVDYGDDGDDGDGEDEDEDEDDA